MKFRRHARFRPSADFIEQVETGRLGYSAARLQDLRDRLAGQVSAPGYTDYNDRRMGFVTTYQSYPQLIVFCEIQSDVVAALAFARETGLKAVARSGGHSTAGYSVNEQLVIDTSRIAHVLVDLPAKRVRVGAGANFRKLNLMLDGTGQHVPSGGCETVCVAGYMQGGGYSFTSRLFGMNCDCVEAVTLALADGEIVRADASTHADLFWAVRGGTGSQFGVLLEIEYRSQPLGDLWGFGLRWPLTGEKAILAAAEALALWQARFTSSAAATRLGSQVFLMRAPVSAADPTLEPCMLVRGLFDGTEAACREALGPLLAQHGEAPGQPEIWQSGSYRRLNEILWQTADPPGQDLPNVSMNSKALIDCRIVGALHPAKSWRRVLEFYLDAPDQADFMALEAYGGAINAPAPTDTAFVHRRDSLNLFAWTFWALDSDEERAMAWLGQFGKVAGRLSDGRRYQNYPLRSNAGFRQDYFGQNLDRLQAIKRRYDPDDRFAYQQSLAAD